MSSSSSSERVESAMTRASHDKFAMPLHYPRYTKSDYEAMPENQLDCLLKQYGLPILGTLEHKRKFAIRAFLWSG